MTVVVGCDVGSLTSKAVVISDGRIVGSHIIRSKTKPAAAAQEVVDEALRKADAAMSDVKFVVGTGYGREKLPFVSESVSEIACHARGANWLMPSARTVIDIGGQDCKVIKIDAAGRVVKFTANDKCASGTGRFMEVMAKVLNIGLDELGDMTARAKAPIMFASTCTVWAQADAIKYLNSGTPLEDIGAGINTAMANRVSMLISHVGAESDVIMTGGVAKNVGVVGSLERLIGQRIKKVRKADPQLAGAIGAALIAFDKAGGRLK